MNIDAKVPRVPRMRTEDFTVFGKPNVIVNLQILERGLTLSICDRAINLIAELRMDSLGAVWRQGVQSHSPNRNSGDGEEGTGQGIFRK